MARFAVVLSGCGVYDGSEIHEAVSLLLNLARRGVEYACFAPDVEQMHVIDHTKGEPAAGETRRVLTESARIARGDITPLSELNADDFDGLAFPGGFGAAKNLCTFATDGPECSINTDVERAVKAFHGVGKPIAMCCIAPVIAARVLGAHMGGPGCEVTIGNDTGTADAISAMGSSHHEKPVTEAHVDVANKLVTAPAYMYGDAPIHDVEAGIAAMVEKAVSLMKSPVGA
jgi:enhancing lycopene biosynthesis protein 2